MAGLEGFLGGGGRSRLFTSVKPLLTFFLLDSDYGWCKKASLGLFHSFHYEKKLDHLSNHYFGILLVLVGCKPCGSRGFLSRLCFAFSLPIFTYEARLHFSTYNICYPLVYSFPSGVGNILLCFPFLLLWPFSSFSYEEYPWGRGPLSFRFWLAIVSCPSSVL